MRGQHSKLFCTLGVFLGLVMHKIQKTDMPEDRFSTSYKIIRDNGSKFILKDIRTVVEL